MELRVKRKNLCDIFPELTARMSLANSKVAHFHPFSPNLMCVTGLNQKAVHPMSGSQERKIKRNYTDTPS